MSDETETRKRRQQAFELAIKSLEKIVEGDPNAGENALPPERQLAKQLGISRRMLRAGLERLEASGRIWRHQGKGTFLGARPPSETKEALHADSATNPIEVLEARSEIEPSLAALAALRATPAELHEISRCLKRSQSAADLGTFELWDGTLHRAIAQAAHNSLLLSLYDTINVARSRAFWGRLQDAAITSCGLDQIWLQHKAFVEAIADRDPAGARRLMHEHIEIVRVSMFDLAGRSESDTPPKAGTSHGRESSTPAA